jgi:secretion/DNA translocation related TadE-like protein
MSVGGRRDDRGSASIWVVSCCALLMVIAGVATIRALAVLARHRAESGADLAALAAAGQIGVSDAGCGEAARIARRNGTRLRACASRLAPDGRSGTVLVEVVLTIRLPVVGDRKVMATARAARRPGPASNATPRSPIQLYDNFLK